MKFRSIQNCHSANSGFHWGQGMGIKREEKHLLFTYNFLYYLDFLDFI